MRPCNSFVSLMHYLVSMINSSVNYKNRDLEVSLLSWGLNFVKGIIRPLRPYITCLPLDEPNSISWHNNNIYKWKTSMRWQNMARVHWRYIIYLKDMLTCRVERYILIIKFLNTICRFSLSWGYKFTCKLILYLNHIIIISTNSSLS